jgi:flagellar protein FliS
MAGRGDAVYYKTIVNKRLYSFASLVRSDEMNPVQVYEETGVTTQNNGKLVVMMYEGAIKFLKQALAAIETGDFEAKGRNVNKAKDIIFELNTVLDMEAGGEISQNLRKLYNFMWQRLGQANVKCDSTEISEVISLLEELNRGWKTISV